MRRVFSVVRIHLCFCTRLQERFHVCHHNVSFMSVQRCQKDRIKWEPALLLRMHRVLECTDHLVIQGSMWPPPVGGGEPCSSETAFSKVWAVESGKFVGQSSWAPCSGQELVHILFCVCCCLIVAVGSGNQELFFCSPCLQQTKKNRSLRGVSNLSSCCYGQCYCIVLFLSSKENVSSCIWELMSLCTYQPFYLQFSFYLLASACTRWLGKKLSQTTALLQEQGQSPSIWLLWCFPLDSCPLW